MSPPNLNPPTWQPHPKQREVWTLDLGPLRLSASPDGWWCMGHMKKQGAMSLGGAQVKALIWAREQSATLAAALAAITNASGT